MQATVGGEDWFEAMVWLEWHPSAFRALAARLDEMQQQARLGKKAEHGFGSLPGSGGLWKVHSHGCRLGEAGKGPIMAWRFERDGIMFGLADRVTSHNTNPSAFVRITGEAIIALGSAKAIWEKVVEWFEELGAQVSKNCLSRVDLCLDMPGQSVKPFVDACREERVIRRTVAREEFRDSVHGRGRRDTGITLGKGTLVRIYDKAIECRDLSKRAWLIHRRWGGVDQEQAARVEFQLRRSFLKCEKVRRNPNGNLNRPAINTVEDYFDRRADLVEYLVARWIRFAEVGYDKRHPERAKELPEWTRVVAGFRQWVGTPEEECTEFAPLPTHLAKAEELAVQARGCIEAAAARQGLKISSPEELMTFALDSLWDVSKDDAEIETRILKRMNTLATVQRDLIDCPF